MGAISPQTGHHGALESDMRAGKYDRLQRPTSRIGAQKRGKSGVCCMHAAVTLSDALQVYPPVVGGLTTGRDIAYSVPLKSALRQS